jgi:hypothetical protein
MLCDRIIFDPAPEQIILSTIIQLSSDMPLRYLASPRHSQVILQAIFWNINSLVDLFILISSRQFNL